MPRLFQWLFCFCPIDSGQDVFYTGILCDHVSVIGGKNQEFVPAPASLMLVCLAAGVVVCFCQCGFDVGAWAQQALARLTFIHSRSSSGVKLTCGKYVPAWGWKDWMNCLGFSRSTGGFPCQSRMCMLAFHPPHLEGNLDSFNTSVCACLAPKACSSLCLGLTRCHVYLDSRSLFSTAFGHISPCLLCYLDDSTVNFPLQEVISGEKRELKNMWWILCFLLRVYFPVKMESREI